MPLFDVSAIGDPSQLLAIGESLPQSSEQFTCKATHRFAPPLHRAFDESQNAPSKGPPCDPLGTTDFEENANRFWGPLSHPASPETAAPEPEGARAFRADIVKPIYPGEMREKCRYCFARSPLTLGSFPWVP